MSTAAPAWKDIPRVDQQTFLLCSVPAGERDAQPWTNNNGTIQSPTITCQTEWESAPTGTILDNDVLRITPRVNGKTISFESVFAKFRGRYSGTASYTVKTRGKTEKYTVTHDDGTEEEKELVVAEGVEMTFNFAVILYPMDKPMWRGPHSYVLRVGQRFAVNFAGTPTGSGLFRMVDSPSGGILGHWRDGYTTSRTETVDGRDVTRTDYHGYGSGLAFIPQYTPHPSTGMDAQTSVILGGVARRPGVYVFNLLTTSQRLGWTNHPWDGQQTFDPIIVSIVDDPFLDDSGHLEKGTPVLVLDAPYKVNRDALRVAPFAGGGGVDADYAPGVYAGDRQSGRWTRTAESGWGGSTYYDFEIYREAAAEEGGEHTWKIRRRSWYYSQGGNQYAPWEDVAECERKGGEVPPNNGWNNGFHLAGATEYYIPEHGFFDYKGLLYDDAEPDPATGEKPYNAFPYYEQRPLCCRQYDTDEELPEGAARVGRRWINPPPVRHGEGLKYWFWKPAPDSPDADGEWRLTEWQGEADIAHQKPQTIADKVIVPYSPPTCELYGEHPVRDPILPIQSGDQTIAYNGGHEDYRAAVLTPTATVPAVKEGKLVKVPANNSYTVHGITPQHQTHRALVPLNGTSGDRKYMTSAGISISSFKNVSHIGILNFEDVKNGYKHETIDSASEGNQRYSISAGIDADLINQFRRGNLVDQLLVYSIGNNMNSSAETNYSYEYTRTFNGEEDHYTDYIRQFISSEPINHPGDFSVSVFISSGMDTNDPQFCTYITSTASGNGSATWVNTEIVGTMNSNQSDWPNYEESREYDQGGGVSATSNNMIFAARIDSDETKFGARGYSSKNIRKEFSGDRLKYYLPVDPNENSIEERIVSMRIIYNGIVYNSDIGMLSYGEGITSWKIIIQPRDNKPWETYEGSADDPSLEVYERLKKQFEDWDVAAPAWEVWDTSYAYNKHEVETGTEITFG